MNIPRILQLDFLPRSADLALLILRLWLGLSLFLLHGKAKLTGFSGMAGGFPDPLGVGSRFSLGLAVFAEVVCALLVAVGLFTRSAALVLIILMAVAFLLVHKSSLAMGPGSGELAFVYLAAFVAIFVAGAGRFSIDAKLGRSKGSPKS